MLVSSWNLVCSDCLENIVNVSECLSCLISVDLFVFLFVWIVRCG